MIDPHEVFTPRARDINQKTYVERPALEGRLKDALGGQKYIILYGESGNGKTWLYKKVFKQLRTPYEIINLGNASSAGSLEALFERKLGELGHQAVVKKTTELDAGAKPMGIGATMKQVVEYDNWQPGAFAKILSEISMRAQHSRGVLVLDNFEQIVDDDRFIKDIAGLIISADDESISQLNVKVLIVGTPNNIRHMVSKVSNAYTISNRLVELPEVARLEQTEAYAIMAQGFEKHLKSTFAISKSELYREICWKTDRIAQEVQELCLKISLEAQRNGGIINRDVVTEAEKAWVQESLSADLGTVEMVMNSRDTKVGRKNQVLFCLGAFNKEDFKHTEIEKSVRDRFSVEETIGLNIPQILASFAKADNPLIRKVAVGEGYRFVSPKLKMVVRTRLQLDEENKVIKAF